MDGDLRGICARCMKIRDFQPITSCVLNTTQNMYSYYEMLIGNRTFPIESCEPDDLEMTLRII